MLIAQTSPSSLTGYNYPLANYLGLLHGCMGLETFSEYDENMKKNIFIFSKAIIYVNSIHVVGRQLANKSETLI